MIRGAKTDYAVARRYFDLYSFLSIQDIKSRFRRSRLGIMWIVIQQLAFSLVAGFLWATIFGMNAAEFVPSLSIGFAVWGFLSASLVDGCNTFIIAHGYLKQLPLPQAIFVFRTLLTAIFYFMVNICTSLFILLVFGRFHILHVLYAVPGVLIVLFYFYGISGSMAYLGLRYRDLQHALTAILSLLFIVTPVIYSPQMLIDRGLGFAVYLNPLASLIQVIRSPLLSGEFAQWQHYAIAGGVALAVMGLKLLLSKRWGRFVPFWA